jgi:hypothetical protein
MLVSVAVSTPEEAYKIAEILPERNSQLEAIIEQSPGYAANYAIKVLQCRWPEIEEMLLAVFEPDTFGHAFDYAIELRYRWPELEAKIGEGLRSYWVNRFPYPGPGVQQAYMKDKSLDVNITVDIFLKSSTNFILSYEAQEFIIQHRPDAVGEIVHLDPKLAKKYSHELELSKVDL